MFWFFHTLSFQTPWCLYKRWRWTLFWSYILRYEWFAKEVCLGASFQNGGVVNVEAIAPVNSYLRSSIFTLILVYSQILMSNIWIWIHDMYISKLNIGVLTNGCFLMLSPLCSRFQVHLKWSNIRNSVFCFFYPELNIKTLKILYFFLSKDFDKKLVYL